VSTAAGHSVEPYPVRRGATRGITLLA
jgi:hypothetical protein